MAFLVDTVELDIQYSSIQSTVTDRETITLDPGTYDIQVNFTDWSSFQFAINISCILIILGGLCVGSSTKREPKKDETDWKTTSEYEY